MIHGPRPGATSVRLDGRVVGAIIVCAALTSAHAFLTGFPFSLAIVPVTLLLTAVAVVIAGPHLSRSDHSARVQQVGEHRVAIACGLILIGIALKTLIAHLV